MTRGGESSVTAKAMFMRKQDAKLQDATSSAL